MSPGPINSELNPGTASNKMKKILEMQKSKFVEIQTDSWHREKEKRSLKIQFRGAASSSSAAAAVAVVFYTVGLVHVLVLVLILALQFRVSVLLLQQLWCFIQVGRAQLRTLAN